MSITSSLDLLSSLPASVHPPSSSSRRTLRDSPSFPAAFDVLSQLGSSGPSDGSAYSHGSHSSNIVGQYGHSGCVNALNWSSDGSLLASGSDDTRICLWKIGGELDEQENVHPAHGKSSSERRQFVKQFPGLGMGLQSIIHTGHRANIFSVKFAQHSRSTIFSAAGDHEVRVFDIERASSMGAGIPSRDDRRGREWTEYTKDGGVATRVLKCHRGRVKRIALDSSSPSTFLTCSEDGTVRQHDLRTAHTCKSHCPPPLCSYKSQGIGLYSLTVSSARPELFVVAGTSQYAFLHDRRMVPRLMQDFWRVKMRTENELTMCVRRFGPPVPPLIPDQKGEQGSDSDGEENGSEHGDNTYPGRIPDSRRRRTTTRMRAAATRDSENHVTAAKLSNANGRDLLLTYSGGPVALYDIFADPEGQSEARSDTVRHGSGVKRNRGSAEEEAENPQLEGTRSRKLKSGRTLLSVSPSITRVPAPEEKSDFVAASTDGDTPIEQGSASESIDEPPSRSFEIGVGDDGELEMAIGGDSPSSSAAASDTDTAGADLRGSGMNRDGLRDLLSNSAGAQQEGPDSQVGEAMGDEETYESGRESESDSASDDEDDISSSDDPTMETLQPLLDVPHTSREGRDDVSQEIPLVRPYRIYTGHRNSDTVKDVNFGGLADDLVLSGSDDGNVFVWAKGGLPPHKTSDEGTERSAVEHASEGEGDLLGIWHGDSSVVNVLQWHPFLPYLAVSGIDNTVKLLGPTTSPDKRLSKLEQRDQIVQRNREALSNTEDRWSLPPANVLLRLLAQVGAEDEDEGGEDGQPRRTRRIPLQRLMQLANEGYAQGEGGEEDDCLIM